MLQPFFTEGIIEAGCDEAGRGCLAGPVFAAAVILPTDFYHPLLNDSKQVAERDRELLRIIIEKESIAWHVAMIDHILTTPRIIFTILNAVIGFIISFCT